METSSPTDRLIQPECLSTEELKTLLMQRGLLPQDLPPDRGGIVNLYNRLILPLPQREIIKSSRLSKTLRRYKSPEKCQSFISAHNAVNNNNNSHNISVINIKNPPANPSSSSCPPPYRNNPEVGKRRTADNSESIHTPNKRPKNMISWP